MKNKKILSIPLQKLHETQKVLTAANFELDEIWTPDQGDESQIWSNSKNKSVIEIRITENIEDATREDIKNEIIDVWYEIRCIREVFDSLLEEDAAIVNSNDCTDVQRFENRVKETEYEWSNDKEKMDFLYKSKIDPRILTYLRLDEEEKQKIIAKYNIQQEAKDKNNISVSVLL